MTVSTTPKTHLLLNRCLNLTRIIVIGHAMAARVPTVPRPPGAYLTPHAALSTGDGQQQRPLHGSKVSAPHVVSAGAFGAGGGASGAGGAIAGAAARGGICNGGASFCSGGICSGGICSGGGCRGGGCAAAPWALCKEPCSAAPTAARLCVKHGKGQGGKAWAVGGGGRGGGSFAWGGL